MTSAIGLCARPSPWPARPSRGILFWTTTTTRFSLYKGGKETRNGRTGFSVPRAIHNTVSAYRRPPPRSQRTRSSSYHRPFLPPSSLVCVSGFFYQLDGHGDDQRKNVDGRFSSFFYGDRTDLSTVSAYHIIVSIEKQLRRHVLPELFLFSIRFLCIPVTLVRTITTEKITKRSTRLVQILYNR